jgi:hypothetical protein
VQLSHPTDENSFAGRDLQANGGMMHAVAWRVRDLAQAKDYLASKSIRTVASDDRTLIADPQDTFGAYFRFTDRGYDDFRS